MATVSARLRITAIAATYLAVLVSATGCSMLQGERPDPKVLVLTVENGEVTFMWCGDDATFDTFWIQSRQAGKEPTVTTDGDGPYRLSHGQTFTAERPPEGPDYPVRGTIPVEDSSSIYVGTLSNDDSGSSYRSAFNDVDLRSLPEGTWVTGDGLLTEDPCTQPGAKPEDDG